MSTVLLHITDRQGVQHDIEAPTDMNMNLMEVIRAYELAEEGTVGICGGMAMCASCQCYIESDTALPPVDGEEEAMLAEAYHVQPNSRLSCQIPITEHLAGLRVQIAPEQ